MDLCNARGSDYDMNMIIKSNHRYWPGISLIEVVILIGIAVAIGVIISVIRNPSDLQAQSRNAQRQHDAKAILNAIHRQANANNGLIMDEITVTPQDLCDPAAGITCPPETIDLGEKLVPLYLSEIPVDPLIGSKEDTKYSVVRDVNNKVTVTATGAELNQKISYTE